MIVSELEAGEVMTRRFLAVAPEDTLGEVAERMAAEDRGSALVVDYGRLVGIVTSRDILRAIAARVHPSEARIRDWMTGEPTAAAFDTPISEAARMMLGGGFHHLPVVEDERPVGVVGLRAVIGAVGWPGC
jgi:CBS domain-containing protein